MRLFLDSETFSPTPIKAGTHRYAEPAEIMLVTWAIDDEDVRCEDLTEINHNGSVRVKKPSFELINAIAQADTITIQNSHFDRTLFRHALGIEIPIEKIDDTMVRAMAHGLPGSLDSLCEIYKVGDDAKDKSGKSLIQLFCKPNNFSTPWRRADFETKPRYDEFMKKARAEWPGRATKKTHPAQWKDFCKYAGSDIRGMRAVDKFLPRWNCKGREKEIWQLDQVINDRGFLVDMALAEAAIATVETHQEVLASVTQDKTDGAVQRATQRDALLEYLLEMHNVKLPDMRKATLERQLMRDDLPEPVKDLLRLRLDSSASATSKYKALLKSVSSDHRLRGTLQYAGASRTLRWAGRIFQPQNLMRPTMKWNAISEAIDDIKAGIADMIYDNPILVCANAIRGCIVAPPGKKLVITDLSNIEGRMLAWLAGEEWKIQAFRDYDNGTGPDLYIRAYASAFNIPIETVTKYQRQIGKVMELGLGFGGGVKAFLTFAAGYGLNLDELADAALPNIPKDILAEAKEWWLESVRRKQTYKLSERTFIACDSLKRLWRRAHPKICALWKALENGMTQVINTGKPVTVGRVTIGKAAKWVYIELPSGHRVCYPAAGLKDGKITYMGVNSYTRRFERLSTYGGKLAENCIAEGTEILQEISGWTPIEKASPAERVWDGEKWVYFSHCVYKGKQATISAHGVRMTPEHLVLTYGGWINASSSERYHRVESRLPDGYTLHGKRREKIPVGSKVCMRHCDSDSCQRVGEAIKEGGSVVMRVHEKSYDKPEEFHSWDVEASGFCCMEVDAGPLPVTVASGVAQLRGPRYTSMRPMGEIRTVLDRHGPDLYARPHTGQNGQQSGVFSGELSVGNASRAGKQQTRESHTQNLSRGNDRCSGGEALRLKIYNASLPARPRLEGTRVVPVYDLVNCGPDNRFVVRDSEGGMLIVHNCTQAAARDVLAYNMHRIEAAGYQIVLTVHDEVITEAPDTPEYNADALSALLSYNEPWSEGLPLASAGFEDYRYHKED